MKRIATAIVLLCISFLGSRATLSAEAASKPPRFDLAFQTGLASVLSGPELDNNSNFVARFGFYPSEHFLLTLTYDKWKSDLPGDDILGSDFADVYLNSVSSSVNFRDAQLSGSTTEFEQWELGIQKVIPLGDSKKWQAYVLLGVGLQNAQAQIQWTGTTRLITSGPDAGQSVPIDLLVLPSDLSTQSNVFFVSVAGGIRWLPVEWFGLETELRLVPIDELFTENLNTLELNFGVVFRFGKF